jgi:predicted ATPase
LIVDTPEEGLDSEGVFAELVPLFRRKKEERQIIIVTHNANLPVNADAEKKEAFKC